MDAKPIDFNFTSVNEDQTRTLNSLRRIYIRAANYITAFVKDGRLRATALTRLEESALWANKAISKDGVTENQVFYYELTMSDGQSAKVSADQIVVNNSEHVLSVGKDDYVKHWLIARGIHSGQAYLVMFDF